MESSVAQVKAFLTNRLQRVQVGNCLSSVTNAISGVPQVSGILQVSILFIIYINNFSDFFTGSSVTLKLYADDVKLYSCIQCVDGMHYFKQGLDFIYNWSLAWQLFLSVTKCTMLQLGRSPNINLPMCRKTRDLDILIDYKMNFKEHIYNITASANQRAFLIKQCFLSKDPSSFVKAFKVYLCSLVEYCSPVWSPSNIGLITKLESDQRRLRKVCRACVFRILNV